MNIPGRWQQKWLTPTDVTFDVFGVQFNGAMLLLYFTEEATGKNKKQKRPSLLRIY